MTAVLKGKVKGKRRRISNRLKLIDDGEREDYKITEKMALVISR